MQEPKRLEDAVLSEADLLELFGIDRKTLDDLRRDKGFPAVRLTTRARVYLADQVLAWLKRQSRR